ncbi:MAG TPA: NAD(P)-binding domain-containing protein, partial [Chryseosolibacter sp.]|nr:NAD(P)-binding domain-containing protein [Chryseosolibacter sp.]
DAFHIETSQGTFVSRAVVSATGSSSNPQIPPFQGLEGYKGTVIHSSQYQAPGQFENQRVAVVGEGNSGAQILAEVSLVADTLWITRKEPRFLPDDVDGRFLFDAATQMYQAQKEGKKYNPPSLGDIVMVDTVKDARRRNVLNSLRPFDRVTGDSLIWNNGRVERVDAIIFCTGFKPALGHLRSLDIVNADGKAATMETRSQKVDGLWLVGYGNWTGFASATLIGVGRTAKKTVEEIQEFIGQLVQK